MDTTQELLLPEAGPATSTPAYPAVTPRRTERHDTPDLTHPEGRFTVVRRLLHALAAAGRPPQTQHKLEMLLGPNGSPIWTDTSRSEPLHGDDPERCLR